MRYRQRGLTPADVLLVSYPKSGSTWLRFLLAHLLTGEEADYGSIRTIIPPLGQHAAARTTLAAGGRIVRSHEPLSTPVGPGTVPVLYLLRDARDVCLSYFHHRRRQGYDGDVSSFVETFLAGDVDGYGTWVDHIGSSFEFEAAGRAPFLRVRYEDLRADPRAALGTVQGFLGLEVSPSQIEEALVANTRTRMRAKEDEAFLRRVGMDGDAREAERRPWEELVPPSVDRRFSTVCGRALERAGYTAQRPPIREHGANP